MINHLLPQPLSPPASGHRETSQVWKTSAFGLKSFAICLMTSVAGKSVLGPSRNNSKKLGHLLTRRRTIWSNSTNTLDDSKEAGLLNIPRTDLRLETSPVSTPVNRRMLLCGPSSNKSFQISLEDQTLNRLTTRLGWVILRRSLSLLSHVHLSFPQMYWLKLLTCKNISRRLELKGTLNVLGPFVKPLLPKRLRMLSSTSCNVKPCQIPFLGLSGRILFLTDMSTSRNFMLGWIGVTTTTMNQKISEGATPLSRETISVPGNLSNPNLSGQELRGPGDRESNSSIPIGKLSSQHTWRSLRNCFALPHELLLLPSVSIWKPETGMRSIHIGWTIGTSSILLFLHRCSVHLPCLLRHPHQLAKNVRGLLRHHLVRNLSSSAVIGTSGTAMGMNALSKERMESVTSVGGIIGQRSEMNALQSSRSDDVPPTNPDPRAGISELRGTRSLGGERGRKRKDSGFPEPPLFRRKFVWSQCHHNSSASPAAIATEYAEPLPAPPESLLNDPKIQSTLSHLNRYIKVDTPFNVDRFENLLATHPNQPFVKSVMRGLREGFWPFDEGEWDLESKDFRQNYSIEDQDLNAIRAFRDKEVGLDHWSGPLPDLEFKPGMKVSPMFVIWQHEKPRVITDHAGSGLNDGIPKGEAHVQYDDMHTFSQALYDAIANNPAKEIITFKSDIASAFLNLPAHPLWQIRQIVIVDGKGHVVRRLVFG